MDAVALGLTYTAIFLLFFSADGKRQTAHEEGMEMPC